MAIRRRWAFWRRVQYSAGYLMTTLLVGGLVYWQYFYVPPSCSDGVMNGLELGADCGGDCVRICAFTVIPPTIEWAKSFPANAGQYNAVAYVANSNEAAGTPELRYTFTLLDRDGVITRRSGTTVLPPDSTYPIFEGRIDTDGRTPTETTLTLEPAELWLPSTFGREQFRTSDLNLTGADERPRLTAQVENQALTNAEAVEVVATIFDSAGTPLTASQTFIDEFVGRTSRQLTFTWPRPIAKTLRSCEVPTDVAVVIDLSGSMNNDGANPPEPVTSVLKAAETFVEKLRPRDQVSVVTFASTATTTLNLTNDIGRGASTVARLTIDPREERGTTNTADGLAKALAELKSERSNSDARKVAVVLTDGLATAPGEDPDAAALAEAERLRAADINVFTIGLGESVNMDFLGTIATVPQQAFAAPSTATLASIYSTITAAICEEGAARIDVIPKTTSGFSTVE